MSRVLILFHSVDDHIEEMAYAVAEGAGEAGAEVDVRQVPELAPGDVARRSGYKLDKPAPVAAVDELGDYDAIVIGVDIRHGRMAARMADFLAQTVPLQASGTLNGKVGSAFASIATRHGGQETALVAIHTNLLRLGLVVVGLPSSFAGQKKLDEVSGGSPYGATTISGSDGARRPSANELAGARHQGRHVAGIANRLFPRPIFTETGQTEQTEHFMLNR